MTRGEEGTGGQRKVILLVAGVAVVLIALVIGLTVGKGTSTEESDPTLTTKENFEKAQEAAFTDVRKQTAEDGFTAGRRSGARQGGRAGRRAGATDGAVQAQLEITSSAQSAASSAQAELDGISAAPPTPTAPVEPTPPPAGPGH